MIEFDSKEEKYFSWYLETLRNWGYIDSWEVFEESFILSKPLKVKYIKPMKRVEDKVMEQTILNGRSYNPDFKIVWNEKAINKIVQELKDGSKITTPFICQNNISIIEIKGSFDQNNMTRLANNNIKDVFEKYGQYINMIKVPKIFNDTFTPEMYLLTDKTFKPRKIKYKNVRGIKDFIYSLPE